MTTENVITLYASAPKSGALAKYVEDKTIKRICLSGLVCSSAALTFAALSRKSSNIILFILPDADEAGYFYHDLMQLNEPYREEGKQNKESQDKKNDNRRKEDRLKVLFFPSSFRRAVKYGQKDAANEILRTEVLTTLSTWHADAKHNNQSLYIVTHPEALAEKVASKQTIDERVITLSVNQDVDLIKITQTLREFGFQEVDYVYEPGQFALRGSILDVYSFSSENPFRIDFFGDTIETIRTFDVADQLSKDKQQSINIVPELAGGKEQLVSFIKSLPGKTIIASKDLLFVNDIIDKTYKEGFSSQSITEQLEGATEVEQKEILERYKAENALISGLDFREDVCDFRQINFGSTEVKDADIKIDYSYSPQPLFHKNFELLRSSLRQYQHSGYNIYILADSVKQQQRLKDILDEVGSDHERSASDMQASDISFVPINRTLHEGFVDNENRLCFFTDHQIFDRFHKYNLKSDAARTGKMALTMKALQEMEPGDFLVHVDFGVGKFGGLVRVPSPGGGYQEVIRLIYQGGDIVDVTIHSLYKISKYRRGDTDEPPRLSTLGTGAWNRLKERAKQRIKDIARDLIKLYAKRRHEKGFAYSADDYLQHELEASFLYEDTPDQLKATQDVKHDMESQKPMDRLVCGDVGFGKTEIAVRAAFKAACDSKQVAVLVPTTVLAFQHYQTFRKRLQNFPVRVEYLSRARSAKQTRQIIEDLEAGRIDILIGTHKLISKTVKWHDLGLLIIDEEQKFGVAVKEKLRKLKTNVDTLTMSATPIPRTLQFSLMGARDMSIIRTPPPNRYPIQTELHSFDKEVIIDAINFEMSRNGQVYFVNDRVSNLEELAQMIRKYIPDCRVAIGHGQMPPEELEKIILEFVNFDYDVLISTTIVENGIDISNANTIIINDAHRFGLSDLHQMRGRVGRSNRKAFCYLLAPPKSALSDDARRRLEALETFSDLGSGFALAMQDLDIRGAGNLLGSEQSGFIEDLGYETYQKILNQAVSELKNEEFQDMYKEELKGGNDISGDEFIEDCAIDSDLEMFFPETYVPNSSERMLLYRELDNIEKDSDLDAYRLRLIDRFGAVPKEGEELMQVVLLRRLGKALGSEKITLRAGIMNIQLVSNSDSAYYQSATFAKIINYAVKNPRSCKLKEIKNRRLLSVAPIKSVADGVRVLKEIFSDSNPTS